MKLEINYKIKHFIKNILKSRFITNLVGDLAFLYVYLVGKTSNYATDGIRDFNKMLEKNSGGIFVTWHGRALMLPFFWHNEKQMKALVSPHADGRIIARLLKHFKILSIDGSSDRNASKSALDIIKELNSNTVVALISDGPRGPNMRLNKSVIYFAKKTGKPIMGMTYSGKNAKVISKSWDNMLIPLPFYKGYIEATKPLFVPPTATEEEMEQLRQDFENELNTLTQQLDKKCGLPLILPGNTKKQKR